MSLFYGTAESKIATSKQTTLPKAMADQLGPDPILVPTPGAFYFQLYPHAVLDRLVAKKMLSDPLGQTTAEYISRISIPIHLDPQNRFLVPKPFFDSFGTLTKELVFQAAVTHIRMWPRDMWCLQQQGIAASKFLLEKVNKALSEEPNNVVSTP